MLKNKEGKTPRLLAKDNEHKDALKECRKAEKQSAKLAKGGSRTGEPYAIRVSLKFNPHFSQQSTCTLGHVRHSIPLSFAKLLAKDIMNIKML